MQRAHLETLHNKLSMSTSSNLPEAGVDNIAGDDSSTPIGGGDATEMLKHPALAAKFTVRVTYSHPYWSILVHSMYCYEGMASEIRQSPNISRFNQVSILFNVIIVLID